MRAAIQEASYSYRNEAGRRNIEFKLDISRCPSIVVGDSKKIRTVVQNLAANACKLPFLWDNIQLLIICTVKYTSSGSISVSCTPFDEPEGLRDPRQVAIEIVVADTGCGIPEVMLQGIFREFEQVEPLEQNSGGENTLGEFVYFDLTIMVLISYYVYQGLGLAVVARIVEQLGGQFRAESNVNQGSRFSLLLPLSLPESGADFEGSSGSSSRQTSISSSANHFLLRPSSMRSGTSAEIDSLVEALGSNHMDPKSPENSPIVDSGMPTFARTGNENGRFEVTDSHIPIRGVKVDVLPDASVTVPSSVAIRYPAKTRADRECFPVTDQEAAPPKLRVLIVEVRLFI